MNEKELSEATLEELLLSLPPLNYHLSPTHMVILWRGHLNAQGERIYQHHVSGEWYTGEEILEIERRARAAGKT